MTEIISGIFAAIIILIVSRLLSGYFTYRLIAATILVAIAFIYVGFSLQGGSVAMIILEAVVSLFFYFLAIFGYIKHNTLLAYGIILHGIWDIFHHQVLYIKTGIPGYWPSFCFTVDLIDGLFFLYVLKDRRSQKLVVEK